MNEAPVANRDAPVDRNVLLFRVLMADMTPPLWLIVQKNRIGSFVCLCPEHSKPEGRYQILRTVVGMER
jgi:hypothetical protein